MSSFRELKQIILDLEIPQYLSLEEKIKLREFFEAKLESDRLPNLYLTERRQIAGLLESLALIIRGVGSEDDFENLVTIVFEISNSRNL